MSLGSVDSSIIGQSLLTFEKANPRCCAMQSGHAKAGCKKGHLRGRRRPDSMGRRTVGRCQSPSEKRTKLRTSIPAFLTISPTVTDESLTKRSEERRVGQ